MRKQVIARAAARDEPWLDLEPIARVEMTSEDPEHPIEDALRDEGGDAGWRASMPGEQVIRLLFDRPANIHTIELRFDERASTRTQEFVLRWSPSPEGPWREIVRQQYTFSPPATTTQVERYAADLAGVAALELCVVPDIGGGPALASLSRLRLA